MTAYEVHLPESGSPGQCLAAFGTSISAIGLELGLKINKGMTTQFGAQWLSLLEEARFREAARRNKGYKKSWSPFDLNWIINEPFHNKTSPIREYLPKNDDAFYKIARDLVETRNRWYHDYNPHNINELQKAIELCHYVSSECELDLTDVLEQVHSRVKQIKSGTYKAEAPITGTPPEQLTPTEEPAGDESPPEIQRAVGAVWLGGIPARKVELRSSGSLIDESLQSNVTSELTQDQQERYLKLWRLLFKQGWLWVDELGQVAAYVQGVLRCVGFWGDVEEPSQDPFSKFLLPHSYEITLDALVDRSSGVELAEQHLGKVTASTLKRARMELSDNELVRVTWDGDLICFGSNGVEYLGEIESQDWFAAHFSVATAQESSEQ
jgi:hypothetical protein